MKISHIVDMLNFSGQSMNMLRVAHEQQKQGHEIFVGGLWYREFCQGRGEFPSLSDIRDWGFAGNEGILKFEEKLKNCDIIFYWGAEGEKLINDLRTGSLWKIPKVRVVGHIFQGAFSTEFLDFFDHFVFFSHAEKNMVLCVPIESSTIIGAPVDVKNIVPRSSRNFDKFVFGSLGYAGGKFKSELVEIAGLVKLQKQIPNFQCLVVGSETGDFGHKWGSFSHDNLEERIKRNNVQNEFKIEILNGPQSFINQYEKFYYPYDVLVAGCSNKYRGDESWVMKDINGNHFQPIETFGTVALEAMACGVPVIVEEKGGMRDWVRHKQDGFVANGIEDTTRYLELLYKDVDLYWEMAHAARKRAEDFSIEKITDKYNKLCLDIKYGTYTKTCLENVISLRGNTLDRLITEEVYWKNDYRFDEKVFKTDNPTIVDVGGHIGAVSLRMSQHFPKAQIHLFEPQEDNFKLAEFNLRNKANVKLYNAAVVGVSEHKNSLILKSVDKHNTGSWAVDHGQLPSLPYESRIQTQAHLLSDLFTKIDWLKLDCEGSEFEIIENMPDELFGNIRFIDMEYHGNYAMLYNIDFNKFKERILLYFKCPQLEDLTEHKNLFLTFRCINRIANIL